LSNEDATLKDRAARQKIIAMGPQLWFNVRFKVIKAYLEEKR